MQKSFFTARARNLTAGVSLYGLAYWISTTSPYYQTLLSGNRLTNFSMLPNWLDSLLQNFFTIVGNSPAAFLQHMFIGYLAYAFWYNLIRKEEPEFCKAYHFWTALGHFIRHQRDFLARRVKAHAPLKSPIFSPIEALSLRYFAVKFFFLPVMTSFVFGNVANVLSNIAAWNQTAGGVSHSTQLLYFTVVNIIFLIDVAIFEIGYLFEFKNKSEMRSVEPTVIGWLVTLVCYPPLNSVVAGYLPFGIPNYMDNFFGSTSLAHLVLYLCILLYGIYVLATVALGLRSSNLTNRGIVSWGAYAVVRHPAYISKNLVWIVLSLPFLLQGNVGAIITVVFWAGMYTLRAFTEEKHLLRDPDYVEYCKKVKYRFIPGVY